MHLGFCCLGWANLSLSRLLAARTPQTGPRINFGKKIAGPWPRACQIMGLVHLFQQLFQHFLFQYLLYFSTVNNFQQPIQFLLQRFSNSISVLHPFRIHFICFCKMFEQCFNCCSNNCFLFEKCAREAASPGASWLVNRVSFESGGAPFWGPFLEHLFFTQNYDF